MALTGRKKPVLGQKKAANNFFDADHHFETHKIGFKDFDQQWDVPKRGLEPVKSNTKKMNDLINGKIRHRAHMVTKRCTFEQSQMKHQLTWSILTKFDIK